VDTPRLYKILVRERDREEKEETEKVNVQETSRIKTFKKTLCRKLSVRKVRRSKQDLQPIKLAPKEPNSANSPTKIILQKVTKCFRNFCKSKTTYKIHNQDNEPEEHEHVVSSKTADFQTVTNAFHYKAEKGDTINKPVDETEESVSSARDSAYFSTNHSCLYDTKSDILEETGTANTSFDFLSNPSRPSSFGTSPIPILISTSLTSKAQKKSVTLLLPNTRTREKPFGLHLQTEKVSIFTSDYKDTNSLHHDISSQVRNIHHKAKCEMMEKFPFLSSTISTLFSDNLRLLLRSLSSSMIGDLLFQLRTILFSPLLLMVQSLDVVFCVIIRFLHQVSCLILQSVTNCQLQHQEWLQLLDKWEECFHSHKLECLAEVRTLYIQMWCDLITA